MIRPALALSLAPLAALALAAALRAQAPAETGRPAIDVAYTEEIKKHTTLPCFSTPYVDYLPAADGVPTPKDFLGHIAGAPDVLSYSHQVHAYLRALAEASPRVKVFRAGTSEEGREMILVAVADEATIQSLDLCKDMTARLADPRRLPEAEARRLIRTAKPIYWATGAMHSPETGSPEMLMELVYRLAVDEGAHVKAIRDNLIFLCTPVLDVDGRDKRVDLHALEREGKVRVPSLLYWGKYVAHDNNRDAIAMGLELSRMLMRTFLDWHPQVLHDLHESASHLYTSTGTGPYNAWIDPILVDEWHVLAYQEITTLTKLGVPGVWTHDFYDGWAPNYGFYAANGHNAIGRFYETQGGGGPATRRISSNATRAWYKSNPPLASTMWSIRNNVNLQQSGLLVALHHVATHKEQLLESFWLKSQRSCRKPWNEGPAAYVLPAGDARPGQQRDLVRLLQRQGCEVHQTRFEAKVGDQAIAEGSYVVRMDQPYSRMADMLLDRCYYNVQDPRPYDDTGWTLGPLFGARTDRVDDVKVLDVAMDPVASPLREPGRVATLTAGAPAVWLVDNAGDNALATFRFAYPELEVEAAEAPFEVAGRRFKAGTMLVAAAGHGFDVGAVLEEAAGQHELSVWALAERPEVRTHAVGVPRVAIVHTWQSTQNEGWARMAFDHCRIRYDYISVHDVRDTADLRAKYDVLVFGPTSSDALSVVRGLPKTGRSVAWQASQTAPNIGRQASTADMRGGLELEGIVHLRDFVTKGGTLIAIQSSCSLPVHFGLAEGVSIVEPETLRCSGSVLRAEVAAKDSPIAYGFEGELGVMFRQAPVLRMGGGTRGRRSGGMGAGARGETTPRTAEDRLLAGEARPTGRGTVDDPDRPQGRPRDLGRGEGPSADGARAEGEEGAPERGAGRGQRGGREDRETTPQPRVVVRFAPDHKTLLISGMLAGGDQLQGTPAVVDAPLGQGHVVLFAIQPMWRHITQGSYALVFNAILHFDHLGGTAATATRRDVTEER